MNAAYTPDQIERVARRIFLATSDRLATDDFITGRIPGGSSYPLGCWDRVCPKVRAFYHRWATQSLRIA